MKDVDRLVPRVVEPHSGTELFTLAHLVLSTPQPLGQVGAIAVMPGQGEHHRVISAVQAWEDNPQARYLLVTGTNAGEQTQPQPTMDYLQATPINLRRTKNVETQVSADHTREQADWIVERVQTLGITSLALFVSHWHLPRAYGTFIKSLLDHGDESTWVPVFPVAVASAPDSIVPETGKTVVQMSPGEAERIQKYQIIGQVATLAEVETYLNWLWRQTLVPITSSRR